MRQTCQIAKFEHLMIHCSFGSKTYCVYTFLAMHKLYKNLITYFFFSLLLAADNATSEPLAKRQCTADEIAEKRRQAMQRRAAFLQNNKLTQKPKN